MEVKLIPEGHFCDIRFEDLERKPLEQVEGLYQRLDLSGFTHLTPRLRAYLESIRGYQKNEYAPLRREEKRKIAQAWEMSFKAWDYST